ncbi:MAG TPA: hypothetical protein VFZ75_05600 [Actinomycetota bacterium]|nr:hypothetical protein [Actinomycetota bacterium]
MRAEQAIAAQLARQVGSLTPGHRHLIRLEQVAPNGVGGWRNGPHPVGWLAVSSDGLKIRLVSTAAGRTARALLEEDLLDIVLTGYPAVIRLTALPTSTAALT